MTMRFFIATTSIRNAILASFVFPLAVLGQPADQTSAATAAALATKPAIASSGAIAPKPPNAGSTTTLEGNGVPANNAPAIPNYDSIIQTSLKERERRLGLLSESLSRLRDAGEMGIARRVEARIQALLEMPEAEPTDPVLDQMSELERQNQLLKAEVKELTSKAEKSKADTPEEIKSTSARRNR